jgi:hypothetical protein
MERTNGIFEDLLNIEVNTIVKHSMTAEKMPPLPFALLDIISDYGKTLADLHIDLTRYFEPTREQCWQKLAGSEHEKQARKVYAEVHGEGKQPDNPELLFDYVNDLWPVFVHETPPSLSTELVKFSMSDTRNGWDTFERLRIAALDADQHITDEHSRVLLSRILGSCNRLKYMLQGLQQRPPTPPERKPPWWSSSSEDPPVYAELAELIPRTRNELLGAGLRHKRIPRLLNSDDLALVRKTWEVGVERVLVQTVVQIDGDVLTRVSEELLHQCTSEKREMIMDAHKRSVDIGLSHWRALVQVAAELVGDAFRKLWS